MPTIAAIPMRGLRRRSDAAEDLALTRTPREPIRTMRGAAKGHHVIPTREVHRPDLSELPAAAGLCVHAAMCGANDRGVDCLLIKHSCDAGGNHAAIKMIKMRGGVSGAVASSAGRP